MATIKTEREAAKAFNGQKATLLRAVDASDLSFNEDHGEKQVIVSIDGQEVQFYTDEVILDKDEKWPKPAKEGV